MALVLSDRIAPDAGGSLPTVEGVYRRYAPYVASIALRLGGRRDEVDDLVHDTFLVVSRRLKDLRRVESLKAWLIGITVRIVRRRLRQRRLRGFLGLDGDGSDARLMVEPAAAGDRLMLGSLYRVLDALPADQRLAWILRHVEGEKIEDVARSCGCSLATAKRWIAAAHAKIEEAFRDA